jgi:peptidoglycan/LPS O-acetylase OafA/YrhL
MTITIIVGIVTLIIGGVVSYYLWENVLDKKKKKLL